MSLMLKILKTHFVEYPLKMTYHFHRYKKLYWRISKAIEVNEPCICLCIAMSLINLFLDFWVWLMLLDHIIYIKIMITFTSVQVNIFCFLGSSFICSEYSVHLLTAIAQWQSQVIGCFAFSRYWAALLTKEQVCSAYM